MEIRIQSKPDEEKAEILLRLREERRREIENCLIDARMLYPAYDRHCGKYGFEALTDLWEDVLDDFAACDIYAGFRRYFKTRGEIITPVGVIECIEELYND